MESSQKPESESEIESYTNTSSSPLLSSSLQSSEISSDPSDPSSSSSQPFGPSSQPFNPSSSSSQPFEPSSSSQPSGPSSSSQLLTRPSLEPSSLTSIDIPTQSTTEKTTSISDPTPISTDTELNLYDQPEQSEEEQYQQPLEEQYQQPLEEQYQQPLEEQYQQPLEEQYQQPLEEQKPPEEEQPPEEQQSEEQQSEEEQTQQITQEELQELQERELSLRSKVLNQPLPCQKKQTTPTAYIEKIQVKTPLTDNESTISRQIKEQCKQAFLYFQPLVETTPLQINTIIECEDNFTPTSTPTDEVIETKYKKTATQPLTQFLEAHIVAPNQKNKFIQMLVHTHLQLLHEIQTLQKLDPPIIHFHLTPETLQYNPIDATPVITDFRLAFTKTTLENPEENKDLFPPYENIPQYPFEVFLLSKLQEDAPLELAPIAEAFTQQTNISTPNTTPYETLPAKDIRTKAIAHHLTWDPYAVHHYIYSFMTKHQIPLDRPFMTQYKDFLVSYLTSPPEQRPSIETSRENITNIFKSVPKKDYLVFLASMSSFL